MNNPYFYFFITSTFGKRIHPMTQEEHFHRGIDFIIGDKRVPAGISGRVSKSSFGKLEGHFVQVRTFIKDTVFYVNIFHNKNNLVKQGERVGQDDIVAVMGNTGLALGEHVHYEIFTYNLYSEFVERIINADVEYYSDEERVFFNPLQLYAYLEENNIDY